MSMLNIESFRDTSLTSEPYEYLVLPGFVRADCLKRIDADFPKIEQGGSFPLASLTFGGEWLIHDSSSIKTSFPSFLEKLKYLEN